MTTLERVLRVRDVMTTDVHTVEPGMTLVELDRRLTKESIGGAPVVEDGRLVGVVSRTDAVRTLLGEQQNASRISAYYASPYPLPAPSLKELARASRRLAERIGHMRVAEVMSPEARTVFPDDDLRNVAKQMRDERIHRLPVVEGDALVGIVSSLDLVGAVADYGFSSN